MSFGGRLQRNAERALGLAAAQEVIKGISGIYVMIVNKQAIGLALIATEPRALTIVNIIGSIDLEKLHKLEGQFGVPKLDLETGKAAPRGSQA